MHSNALIATSLSLAAAVALASPGTRADTSGAEERAAQTWDSLSRKQGEPRAAVAELSRALLEAELPSLAALSLSHLGDPERGATPEVRAAARAELIARAEKGDALAFALLLGLPLEPAEVAAHSELAVRLAREHLETALLDRPLPEGASFEAEAQDGSAPVDKASVANAPVDNAAAIARQEAHAKLAAAELGAVQQLAAAVPARSPDAAEAHEVAGLAALAAGDELTAEREFGSLAGESEAQPSGRSQKALLQLARLAYARGDDARAMRLYARVGRGAPEWLDALFEASWSHFRRGEDERVLGNLLTLEAPFFQGRYFPEAFVLQALVLYENCRYADARRALGRLESLFRPRHEALSAAVNALDGAQQSFEALTLKRPAAIASLPPPARAELDKAAAAPELQALRAAVLEMGAELDSFDRRPALRDSRLSRTLLPTLRDSRLQLMAVAGSRLRARLASERAELRELLGQSLRLSYEISGRERDQATQGAARATARAARPPELEDDEVLWPFQGEYWRDELGSYNVSLGTRCTPAPRFKVKPTSARIEKDRGRPDSGTAPTN